MKTVWLAGVALVGVSAVLWFLADGTPTGEATARRGGAPAGRIMYYRDPMHPSYTSDKPGKAPDCGMDLVPVYADEVRPAPGARPPMAASYVQVDRERQQLIGVKLGRVERESATHTLRTFGRVALDENRVFAVTAAGEGWVTEAFAGTATGDTVHKGQALASVYGREYSTAQRTFLFALRAAENAPPVAPGALENETALALQEARLILRNTGLGDAQLERLAKTREVIPEVTLTAPADGVIVSRKVFPKERIERGAELFRIADLTRVSILADLFGDDDAYIRRGSTAIVSLPDNPSVKLRARVAEALPRFDRESRTLKLRLEAENSNLILRPDMPVDLEFSTGMPAATTVPADAIVESGLRKTVFVEHGEGVFEERAVETGWRAGGRVQILRGLQPDESIVVSGNFLLGSEIRMRPGNSGLHD